MLTIDDLGKEVCVSGQDAVRGILGAVSGRDETCLVRLPLSGLVIGWTPMAQVELVNEEAS